MQQTALQVHRYGGLAAALVLLVVSVTGSALIVLPELEAGFRSDTELFEAAREMSPTSPREDGERPVATRVELEAVRASVAERFGEEKVRCIDRPARRDRPVTVWIAGPRKVLVHPYSGEVLSALDPETTWTRWISDLHAELLAGSLGRWVVGVSGLLLALLSVTGLVIRGGRRGGAESARSADSEGTCSKIDDDLHRVGGFWTGAVCFLIGLTGAGLVFYPAIQTGSGTRWRTQAGSELDRLRGSELRAQPVPQVEPASHGERVVPLDAALETARRMWPGGRVSVLCLPDEPTDPLTVRIRTAGDLAPRGRSFLHLDPYRGNVIGVRDAAGQPLSRRIRYALRPLHIGSFAGGSSYAGWVVRALYVLIGCAPVILTVTGTLMWYRGNVGSTHETRPPDSH